MSERPPDRAESGALVGAPGTAYLRRPLTQERAVIAVEVVAALALETLPVMAWLVVLAANNDTPADVPLPYWWIFLVALGAWGAGVLLRRARVLGGGGGDDAREAGVVVFLGWAVTSAAAVMISPAAFLGSSPGTALATLGKELSLKFNHLGTDYLVDTPHLGPTVGLVLLTAYLWWRGLWLARAPLGRGRLYARFLFGFAALAAAVAGNSAVPERDRGAVEGPLALMVVAEGFLGLTGIALAQVADALRERQEMQRRVEGHGGARQAAAPHSGWMLSAAGLSAGVVLVAGLLAAVVAPGAPQVIGALVRPVADALRMLVIGVLYMLAFFAFLAYNILAPILAELIYALERLATFFRNLFGISDGPPPAAPKPGKPLQVPNSIPSQWVTAGEWALVVGALAAIVIALVRIIRRVRERGQPEEFEEERQALDASDVLGNQLRDLLNRFRRRGGAQQALDDLVPGSVRERYRAMLRAARRVGLGRRAGETPDELRARLERTLRAQADFGSDAGLGGGATGAEVAAALAALTGAYDDARYGGASAAEQGAETRVGSQREGDDAGRVIAWLDARER